MKFFKGIKTYLKFTTNSFQRNLSYRANAIMYFLGDAVILAVTYYLWKAIYTSSPESIINGFSFNEMIIYMLMSFLTSIIISADVTYKIASEVKDGSIAINLIRPLNYEKRMLFEGLGNILYSFIFVYLIGFIVVSIYMINTKGFIDIESIVLYFLSIILGFFINFFYSYIFGLVSFKITNMWGLSQIMQAISQLLSGALIPISFFPQWAQGIFDFLPFSSMIYTPTMIYLGKLNSNEIIKALAVQVVWIIILAIIGRVMWNALIKQLTILGG